MQWVIVKYYNVRFILMLKGEDDILKFSYLQKRIEDGEQLFMRDIYSWCSNQRIDVISKFEYLKGIPITANLWNFYSYLRVKGQYKKL